MIAGPVYWRLDMAGSGSVQQCPRCFRHLPPVSPLVAGEAVRIRMHGELYWFATAEYGGASRPALAWQVSEQSEQLIALFAERVQRRSER